MKKYKILVIHDIHVDTPNGRLLWAYARRSAALAKYAPDDMDIETCQTSEIPWERVSEFDLIYSLEYALPNPAKYRSRGFKGAWVMSYNSDSRRRPERWPSVYTHADFVVVNNQEAFLHHGRLRKTCCISNGVDTEIFRLMKPVSEREHLCIFAGSSSVVKGKGWEVLSPLRGMLEENGFKHDFRAIDDINPDVVMPTDGTVNWYNSASYVLCASHSDATPNYVSESVSCGCIVITVPIGNAQEWMVHGDNGMFCDRTPESFLQALLYARQHRERLSAAGMKTMHEGWSYGEPGNRAQYFYSLFRRIIEDGAGSVAPFSYSEKHWSEI